LSKCPKLGGIEYPAGFYFQTHLDPEAAVSPK
jgi:hypothetical protein